MEYTPDADYRFYTDTNGNVFANARGLNRLVSEKTYLKFNGVSGLKSAVEKGVKKAVVLTAGGLQGAVLYDESQITEVVKYYALQGKPQAIVTLDILLGVGIKIYIQDLTGYRRATPDVKEDLKWLDLREKAVIINLYIMKTPAIFNQLNLAYFGVECSKHKESLILQDAALYDNLPDYTDWGELVQLVSLRENFVRSRGDTAARVAKAVVKTKKTYSK